MKTNGLHRKKPQCARAAWRSERVHWSGLRRLISHEDRPGFVAIKLWHRVVRNAR